jgi:outer membrane protein TolC
MKGSTTMMRHIRSFGSRFGSRAALLICVHARAAAGEVVRLQDLEDQAVHQRAQVAGDRAEVAAARADADVARSAYSPTLAVNVFASGEPGGRLIHVNDRSGVEYLVAGSRPLGAEGAFIPELRYGGLLSLQGRIYDFGRTRAGVVAADARVEAANARGRVSRIEIVNEVRAAYLDWLGAGLLHAVSRRALANSRARLELVQARVSTGTRPPSDLAPARYEQTLAEMDDFEARQRVENAKISLEHAAGAPLPKTAAPDASLLDREPSRSEVRETPEIVALRRQRASALAMARYYEHGTTPVLSGTAEAGVRGQTTNVFPVYRALVSLVIPIWDGGAADAQAARAREEAASLDAKEREHRALVKSEHARAWNDWVGAAERLRLAESLYALAATRSRDAEERYSVGEGKIESVLETSAGLSRAEREVVLAKIYRTDAVLRLETRRADGPGSDSP